MITAAHVLLYSKDPDADRAFFRDVLKFRHVDIGHGWLIFQLPPSELALHPVDSDAPAPAGDGSMIGAEMYLMCDDLESVVASLKAASVRCGPVAKERWGIRTSVRLPSGAEVGLYQPLHPTAYDLA
jgi:catechol 2,3-dioxygenase-like lactoylglutathione lyase family enzyme